LSKVKKKKRLTDKHFKSWDRQRIHRFINKYCLEESRLFWLSGILGSLCGAYIVYSISFSYKNSAFLSYYLTLLGLLSIPTVFSFFKLLDEGGGKTDSIFDLIGSLGMLLALPWAIPAILVIIGWIYVVLFFGITGILNVLFGIFFYNVIHYTLSTIGSILYSPPPYEKERILIDPSGNPEMCFLREYPALEGFYGYRLPNVGDLSKIERYMNNC